MKKTSTKFDYSKLRGRIREKYRTQAAFAATLGISPVSLSAKLGNRTQWTQVEIAKAAESLGFDLQQVSEYFFS